MSWEALARIVVDALGPGTFQAVVTGDMVRNGKPHPEPYLTAAAALGDLHEGIDAEVFDIAPLLEWADRDEAEGKAPPVDPGEEPT